MSRTKPDVGVEVEVEVEVEIEVEIEIEVEVEVEVEVEIRVEVDVDVDAVRWDAMDDSTQLDWVYTHERDRAESIWLTQPMGEGVMRDFTFAEGMREARCMAAYLRSLELPVGTRIGLFSKNTAWWLLADLAIWMAGHVTVPVYPTLTPKSIRGILEHAEAKLVLIGKLDGFAAMEPGLPDGIVRITLPLAPKGATREGVRAWDAIIKEQKPIEDSPHRSPDDLATIIYTSGSTGEPKGAMHSFRSMCAAAALTTDLGFTPEDRMLSYLPLAHVAERACMETPNFKVGFRVFFAESLETFPVDLRRARPTIFGSVPRLWQKLQSGVFSKMPPGRLALLLKLPIVRGIIQKKVREGLGLDASRLFITGSAPTPPELVHWYATLGMELDELYGMTENFAFSHYTRKGEGRVGWVGTPARGVTAKLSAEGEVLVKSPGNMLGYYKNESLTREAIDEEGFLHTGDRGEIDDKGALCIRGRVKELFKTSKGKYVAPAPLESALLAHPDIDQACVSGVGRPQPYALVVLSAALRARAENERGDVEARLREHMKETNAAFDQHERLDKLLVVPEEWTPENGLLTPTLKLRRAIIEERYAERVPKLLEREGQVVWL